VLQAAKQTGELEAQLATLQQQLNITRKENDVRHFSPVCFSSC
jgi:hypothetical protein